MPVQFHEIQSIRGPGVLRVESGGGNSSGYIGMRHGEEKEQRDGVPRNVVKGKTVQEPKSQEEKKIGKQCKQKPRIISVLKAP